MTSKHELWTITGGPNDGLQTRFSRMVTRTTLASVPTGIQSDITTGSCFSVDTIRQRKTPLGTHGFSKKCSDMD